MIDPLILHAAVDILLDDAVDLQIRITADRRGKVAVILKCKSEMPLTLCRISRLLHGTKCQPADQSLLRLAGDGTHQLLNLLRMNLILLDL